MPIVDAACPCALLNLAWHRLGWPPVESLRRRRRRRALAAPAADAARAPRRSSRSTTSTSSTIPSARARRSGATIRAGRARPRADAVVVVVATTRPRGRRARVGVDASVDRHLPAGRAAWTPRRARRPAGPDPVRGHARAAQERRRLLDAYASCSRARRMRRRWCSRAASLAGVAALMARAIEPPPLAGHVSAPRLRRGCGARRALPRRRRCSSCRPLDEGFGMPALEAMTVGVPVIAADRGALPEVVGDAGRADRSRRRGRLARRCERCWTIRAAAERGKGSRARRAVSPGRQRARRLERRLSTRSPAALAADAPLRIGIDARELLGEPTGVGRYLGELLRGWAARPDAQRRGVRALRAGAADRGSAARSNGDGAAEGRAAAPGGSRPTAPRAARRSARRVLRPAYTAPLGWPCRSPSPFTTCRSSRIPSGSGRAKACGGGWLTRGRRARRRSSSPTREFSRDEIVARLAPRRREDDGHPARDHVARAGASRTDREPTVLFVGSLFNRRRLPDLIAAFAAWRRAISPARGWSSSATTDVSRAGSRAPWRAALGRDRVVVKRYVRRRRAGGALRARVGLRVPVRVRGLRHDAARGAGRRRAAGRARHAVAREVYGDAARVRAPRRRRRR